MYLLMIRESEKRATSIPYGYPQRPMDGKDPPIQRWMDVSNEGYGVSIIIGSSYSADIHNSTTRLFTIPVGDIASNSYYFLYAECGYRLG